MRKYCFILLLLVSCDFSTSYIYTIENNSKDTLILSYVRINEDSINNVFIFPNTLLNFDTISPINREGDLMNDFLYPYSQINIKSKRTFHIDSLFNKRENWNFYILDCDNILNEKCYSQYYEYVVTGNAS